MAGIKFHPEDWGEMLQAVRDWMAANVPTGWTAVFGKFVPGAPQPDKPFAVLNVLVPPVQDGQGDGAYALLKGCAVGVKTVANATTYTILYDSAPATYLSDADATLDEILDGLVAAVNALAGSTVASKVANTVHITTGTVDVDDDPNLALKIVRSTEAEATATFQVDCIGRDEAESAGGTMWESVAAMSKLQLSLETDEVQEQLRAAGWAIISVEGERKPDVVLGSVWEDRSGFDLRLRCRTRDVRVGDFIEDAPIGTSIVGTLSP